MKKQTGFTLIELMIATVILVIMVSVALPSMKSFLDRGNLNVVAPIFEMSLKYARSEAIQRSRIIRITPLSGNGDWSQGWDVSLVTGPNLELIRTFDALPGDTVFKSATFGATTALEILPSGQARSIGDFRLNRADCVGGQLKYSVLLSGNLNRTMETTCS